MDDFEKHIRENAARFNDHKADRDKIWGHISVELQKETTKVVPFWRSPLMRIAASIVLLVGLAGIIGISVWEGRNNQDQYVSKELTDIDMHYGELVAYHVELVKNNPKLSKEDKAEFLSFMDELDAEYDILRLEMRKNLDNEQVLIAIVANYKKRIALIENLLMQLNDAKKMDENYGYTL